MAKSPAVPPKQKDNAQPTQWIKISLCDSDIQDITTYSDVSVALKDAVDEIHRELDGIAAVVLNYADGPGGLESAGYLVYDANDKDKLDRLYIFPVPQRQT